MYKSYTGCTLLIETIMDCYLEASTQSAVNAVNTPL